MLLNPPYGERIAAAGAAGQNASERAAQRAQGDAVGREAAHTDDGGEFFSQLAAHWKKNYAGWTAWMLTPDLKLPSKMRLKESRRVPMWNGPIECRLFRFDMVKGTARARAGSAEPGVADGA
jgi:putative N6-adenine-specific DNA methylase